MCSSTVMSRRSTRLGSKGTTFPDDDAASTSSTETTGHVSYKESPTRCVCMCWSSQYIRYIVCMCINGSEPETDAFLQDLQEEDRSQEHRQCFP